MCYPFSSHGSIVCEQTFGGRMHTARSRCSGCCNTVPQCRYAWQKPLEGADCSLAFPASTCQMASSPPKPSTLSNATHIPSSRRVSGARLPCSIGTTSKVQALHNPHCGHPKDLEGSSRACILVTGSPSLSLDRKLMLIESRRRGSVRLQCCASRQQC